MKFWAGLFLLGAGLGCILGWHVWPGIFAGAGAAPYRTALRALAVPAGFGALGVAVAFAARRFAEDRFLWLAVVAAVAAAAPAADNIEILVLILVALETGGIVQAWRDSTGFSFFAGACGGFAVWVTPAGLPAVLLAMAPLLIRWLRAQNAAVLVTWAAGCFDVIGFGYAIHPPAGGYVAPDIHHLSVLYVVLAVALLAAATILRRLQSTKNFVRGRTAGAVMMAGLLLLWCLLIWYFSGHDNDRLKLLSAPDWRFTLDRAAGILALAYVIWRAIAARGGWPLLYLAGGILALLALGLYVPLYARFPAVIAAALTPVAVSELLRKSAKTPGLSASWPEA